MAETVLPSMNATVTLHYMEQRCQPYFEVKILSYAWKWSNGQCFLLNILFYATDFIGYVKITYMYTKLLEYVQFFFFFVKSWLTVT